MQCLESPAAKSRCHGTLGDTHSDPHDLSSVKPHSCLDPSFSTAWQDLVGLPASPIADIGDNNLVIFLTIALTSLAVFVLLSTVSEAWSILRLPLLNSKNSGIPFQGPVPSFVFLVPAHDEELLIASCLTSLQSQRFPAQHLRIVVVADNCTDQTAEIARLSGAEVLERSDPVHRGKPWAIAWALRQLNFDEFDALVIIDADTEVSTDFAESLASHGPLRNKVLQPFIGVQNPNENSLTRMSAVYERVVHGLAYRMKARVGLNVPLGVGMCLGSGVLKTLGEWPALSIGEDVELYAILTGLGIRIESAPSARITAQETSSLAQSGPQRHRWTAGRIQVLRRHTFPLILNRRIHPHQRLDTIAEIATFGPVVHLGLVTLGVFLSIVLQPPGSDILIAVFLFALLRLVIYTFLAIAWDPHPGKAILAFGYLPVYAIWRNIQMIKSLIRSGEGRWQRTDRHKPGGGS